MASTSGASSSSSLPSWPPALTQHQIASLSAQATDYALSHGIVYRPQGSPPSSTHVHHAPLSLFPSPFPRSAFTEAIRLQPILNELYATVALDGAFLAKVIGGNVAKVDDFTRRLWGIYEEVYEDDNGAETGAHWHLGLFRSDYLLHSDSSSPSSPPSIRQVEFNTISSSFGPLCTKVGEMHRFLLDQTSYYDAAPEILNEPSLPRNTALTVLVNGLAAAHRVYARTCKNWTRHSLRILFIVQESERNAFDQRWIEYELLRAHGIKSLRRTFDNLVTQPDAISIGSCPAWHDPRQIIYVPLEGQNVRDHRCPEISVVYWRAGYTPDDYKSEKHWQLRQALEDTAAIKCPSVPLQLAGAKKVQQVLSEPGIVEEMLPKRSKEEIKALRATWSDLYPLDDSKLGTEGYRLAMEESERFVMKPQREGGGNNVYRSEIPRALRRMEERDARGGAGRDLDSVKQESEPEGPPSSSSSSKRRSSRNTAKTTTTVSAADSSTPREREGYILMELISPPSGLGNYLIRPPSASSSSSSVVKVEDSAGSAQTIPTPHSEKLTAAECRLSPDVVSELGVYGCALFSPYTKEFVDEVFSDVTPEEEERAKKRTCWWESSVDDAKNHGEYDGDETEEERAKSGGLRAPYLLRTKGRESDEGGVAVGFSVVDSVVLVD
ncbi:glutathione synthase [Jaminaea rosea]|uniref:glutathione synthase n=1 Tax=Jaminaea rosea TaxID=1569628 RepID=A0A316UJ70_9BASI|nr:glutathione synthase [Jaminaea rosea]PWN25270.1 glutathione synthase [Jaminaea rosea]